MRGKTGRRKTREERELSGRTIDLNSPEMYVIAESHVDSTINIFFADKNDRTVVDVGYVAVTRHAESTFFILEALKMDEDARWIPVS